jgi:hypothetical protein
MGEIGELKYAYRIAQQTQPLADTASRISSLVTHPRAEEHRTVAVLVTSKGTYIAPSGARGFEDDQLDAIGKARAIKVEAAGREIDAEIAAFGARGGVITSPTTAMFPRNSFRGISQRMGGAG